MLDYINTKTVKKEKFLYLKLNVLGLSFLFLLLTFYPQYSFAFFHTNNQMNSPLSGNFDSSTLYSNPGSLYDSNFGTMFGGGVGGLSGLGMNNGFGMMGMPGFGYGSGYGYGVPSFGSGLGAGGGVLDVFAGLLGGLSSPSYNQGFGSDYNFDYGYDSNYDNNNLDYTLQPNNDNLLGFGGLDSSSNYDSNFDYNYGNEYPSDLPVEDLRSFDS